MTHKYQVKTTQLKEEKKQQHELVDIVNIALSSNVIGLEDHVFSPNWLPVL